ncbi:MAG: hypothetical protein ACPL3B_05740 [Fervidobacterium sp.]
MKDLEKKLIIFHLMFDCSNEDVDESVKKLQQLPNVQIWKVGDNAISIGKLPNIFKAIPINRFYYSNGWLTIKMNEKMLPTNSVFLIVDAEDEQLVSDVLKVLSTAPCAPRLRAKEVVSYE